MGRFANGHDALGFPSALATVAEAHLLLYVLSAKTVLQIIIKTVGELKSHG